MREALQVIRATVNNLDALAELFDGYRQFYRQPPDLAGGRDFLAARLERDQSVIFLASGRTGALGFTQLFPSFTSAGMAPIYILNDLFVRPAARGRGVATSLLREAASFAREQGAVRMTLSTEVGNAAAQMLYEREGWQRDEAFRVYRLPLT